MKVEWRYFSNIGSTRPSRREEKTYSKNYADEGFIRFFSENGAVVSATGEKVLETTSRFQGIVRNYALNRLG